MDFEIQLPEEITNLMNGGGLPSPEMMNFYVDEKDRIFFIDFEIDQSLIEIERKILQYNRIDKDVPVEQRKPIKLFIYSYGGELDAMFSFIDVVALSKTPVWTINAGIAMSVALVMLLSGQKRFALPHSTALIHSGSGGTQGTFEQSKMASGGTQGTFEQSKMAMDYYEKQVVKMREYIMAHSTIDKKTMTKNKAKDWYLDANEQVNFGIVDKICDDVDEFN